MCTNKPKYRVAILYIATGRYTVFWDGFFKSAEKYLLLESQKEYFIFTDTPHVLQENERVHQHFQSKLGWPFDTLKRFEIFLSIKDQLKGFDFIYFFNGNTEFVTEITEQEFLPLDKQQNLTLLHQPHLFHRRPRHFPYDRNKESLACIPYNEGMYYFTGALNGGKASAYLEMCEQLNKNTNIDLKNNVIALFHDESHLNRYVLGRDDVKILDPYFAKGETEYWKHASKVMFSDKTHYRFGGHDYLRGESDHKITQDEWENGKKRNKKRYKFRLRQAIHAFFIQRSLK
ncbi:family 6 glucosyltransferase [Acinetobacter boissieri]|uniref:Glycosyltransferase family 6 n=1 Tax=Acinetobacter boissieri TaxID=1219383 RepID=A0A1G6GGM3_9GAMM|nr:family 6 glucosyltransferase [Acinetobacter boissieri]SDB80895.1 Glycosyltransferase family 6 [Acinetobacter boissieri]